MLVLKPFLLHKNSVPVVVQTNKQLIDEALAVLKLPANLRKPTTTLMDHTGRMFQTVKKGVSIHFSVFQFLLILTLVCLTREDKIATESRLLVFSLFLIVTHNSYPVDEKFDKWLQDEHLLHKFLVKSVAKSFPDATRSIKMHVSY